jgi:phage shock protein C
MTATAETLHTETPQDNLFGVCNALGEDFGFNPLWLRLALAVTFLFAPVAIAIGYFAMGGAVLAARWMFPDPDRKPRPTAREWILPAPAMPAPANQVEAIDYAKAA